MKRGGLPDVSGRLSAIARRRAAGLFCRAVERPVVSPGASGQGRPAREDMCVRPAAEEKRRPDRRGNRPAGYGEGERTMHYSLRTVWLRYEHDHHWSAAYGILCEDYEEDGFPLFIDDITPSRSAAEYLVTLCNRLELAPEHLRDVVDDFLLR